MAAGRVHVPVGHAGETPLVRTLTALVQFHGSIASPLTVTFSKVRPSIGDSRRPIKIPAVRFPQEARIFES